MKEPKTPSVPSGAAVRVQRLVRRFRKREIVGALEEQLLEAQLNGMEWQARHPHREIARDKAILAAIITIFK